MCMNKVRLLICKIIAYLWRKDANVDVLKKRIAIFYKLKTGKKLNIDNAATYTEKVQLYKLFLMNKGYEKYTDKVAVRDWIKNKIGEKYLIPIYGVWTDANDINFDKLPKSFVLKTNHGAGMNMIIKDKDEINVKDVVAKINRWLNTNYAVRNGFEFQYRNIKPLVYAEKLISNQKGELPEYKFICFSGVPSYCMVDTDRFGTHKRSIYNMHWILQPWNIGAYENADQLPMPNNFFDMIEIAKILSNGFSHVRVDLYNVDGKIFFSEMTYTTGSGYSLPKPEGADKMLGDLWKIDV